MRNSLFLLLAWLAAITSSRAQVIRAAGDTTTINQDLRAACSTLNAGRTSTGVLLDQVMSISNWHSFSGTGTLTENSYTNWVQQYDEYYKAHFDQGGLPATDAMLATVRQYTGVGQMALVVLSGRYDEFKSNAMSSGLSGLTQRLAASTTTIRLANCPSPMSRWRQPLPTRPGSYLRWPWPA